MSMNPALIRFALAVTIPDIVERFPANVVSMLWKGNPIRSGRFALVMDGTSTPLLFLCGWHQAGTRDQKTRQPPSSACRGDRLFIR